MRKSKFRDTYSFIEVFHVRHGKSSFSSIFHVIQVVQNGDISSSNKKDEIKMQKITAV